MSLKPVVIMLAILGGLVYYMMRDIKKLQVPPANTKSKPTEQIIEEVDERKNQQRPIDQVPEQEVVVASVNRAISVGSVCGVVKFECAGSFVGDTPNFPQQQAVQIDATFCDGHNMGQPQCVFLNPLKGFSLEGVSCPEGYRAFIHPGSLLDQETGEGATKTTNILQQLLAMCVKQ